MSTYSKFENDSTLEQGGITLDLGQAGKFVIARAGGANKSFAKKFHQLTKPIRRAIQTESVDEKTSLDILIDVYVETILIGWEGVTDREGKPFPFSKVNAKKLFSDLPDLFAEIRRHSEDETLFRAIVMEEDAKNSGGS